MKERKVVPTGTRSSTLKARIRSLARVFFALAFLAAAVGAGFTPARADAAWSAYNDCVYLDGQLNTNITTIACETSASDEPLVNYADGAPIPDVTVTVEASGVFLSVEPGANAVAGTDAYDTFNGIADMIGLIRMNDEDDYINLTFKGLDPTKTYTFATTADRGRNAPGYIIRRTRFMLQGAEGAVNASTSGAEISTTNFQDDTIIFSTGYNTENGYVARWTNIQPGADGEFTVNFTIAYDESNPDDPIEAYGPAVFLLQEEAEVAPVLDPIGDQTVDEGSELAFTASASDANLDPLVFSLEGAPEGATIDPVSGEFTWTPTEEQGPGEYTFTVRVCDDGALCAEEEITVSVAEVNSAPSLAEIGDQSVNELEELAFTAVGSDPDLPANTLTYSLDGAPEGASIDPVSGEFTWTPAEAQGPGEYTFTVRVCDDGGLCAEEEITVSVAEVNSAPQAVDDQYNVQPGETLQVAAGDGVLANDFDVDGDGLIAVLAEAPAQGVLVLNEDGSFTYTPAEGFTGTVTFSYVASDGQANSNVAVVTIEVGTGGGVPIRSIFLPFLTVQE